MKKGLGSSKFIVAGICLLALNLTPLTSQAAWTMFSLPNLPKDFAAYHVDHLSDGRYVFGTNNAVYLQDAFGTGAYTQLTDSGSSTYDPSFVAVSSDALAVAGQGTFGASSLLLFNPSTTGSQTFTSIGAPLTLQNYSGTFWDGSSLLIGGGNGSSSNGFGGNMHSINYVTTDGNTNKIIIDDISTFSGDFSLDSAGNLYVSDNDDLKLYKFTQAQITSAISGSALSITDGTLVTTLAKNGSLAIDSAGRIWSAGYQSSGIDVYDPSSGLSTTYTPEDNNTNYVVSTFTDGSDDYVAFVNASGTTSGSLLTYGYSMVSGLAIPEPTTYLMLIAGFAAVYVFRLKK